MADPRDWREDADYSGPGRLYIAAARLAGMAGALLGWRPREFWNATPAELGAILNAMEGETRGSRGLRPSQCWIVPAGAGRVWAGNEVALACWTASGWRFVPPVVGMQAWNIDAGYRVHWNGTAWSAGELPAAALLINGAQVVGPRLPEVPSPSGGTIIDVEARAAVDALIATLKSHGLIES